MRVHRDATPLALDWWRGVLADDVVRSLVCMCVNYWCVHHVLVY